MPRLRLQFGRVLPSERYHVRRSVALVKLLFRKVFLIVRQLASVLEQI